VDRERWGVAESDVEEVKSWLGADGVVGAVAEQDGAVMGYGDRWCGKGRDRAALDIRVREGDLDTASALVGELETLARPDVDPGALAAATVPSSDVTVAEALTSAGYARAGHSFRMTIELTEPLAPVWPPGIAVATYAPEHEREFHLAHQEAFADLSDHVSLELDEWRKHQIGGPSFDPSLWLLARESDEVAGVLIAEVREPADGAQGFVNVLAVRKRWRGRGLGMALLVHAFETMRSRGLRRAGLGVDGDNPTGAVRLYERAGMTVERRYDRYEKVLS
jgi:mycothiol synthase